jgi:hypothetical protein
VKISELRRPKSNKKMKIGWKNRKKYNIHENISSKAECMEARRFKITRKNLGNKEKRELKTSNDSRSSKMKNLRNGNQKGYRTLLINLCL